MSTQVRLTTLLLLIAVVALGVGASVGWADQTSTHVKLYHNTNRYSSGVGGEFQVQITAGALSYVTSPETKGDFANGFRTFCVQRAQTIALGTEYSVKVASVLNHGTNTPLRPEVAYLFHLWNTGKMDLAGYKYNYVDGTGANQRVESAGHLQNVIWGLQAGRAISGAWENAWYNQAVSDVASAKWTGLRSVRVLQLHPLSDDPLDAQDQLIETPEPATLALLAIGALPVLPIVRRRRSLA